MDPADDNVGVGASDIWPGRNSEYRYQRNSVNGTINAFGKNGDGSPI